MNILLVSPNIAETRIPEVYNLGLGYVARSLLDEGHKVNVLDAMGYRYSRDEVISKLKDLQFDVVGIGTIISGYGYVKWLAKEIKSFRPNVKIWAGNTVATSIPEILLRDTEVDVAVIGEAEITVKELAKATCKTTNLNTVDGICFADNGKIIRTPPRKLISNIDTIPFPAWELFPQDLYLQYHESFRRKDAFAKRIFYISTSRGCPFRCTYCFNTFKNRPVRFHSAERIVEEIKRTHSIYGTDGYYFADDLFLVSKKRVYEFCDLIEKEKLTVKWSASSRVDLLDEEILKRMKSAGCMQLGIGIESGSQKILDNIKKGTTVEQSKRAIKLCKKAGIYPKCTFMIGNVGESIATIKDSISFIEKNYLAPVRFFFTTPYPGTELYEYAKKAGKIEDEVLLFESYGEQSDQLLVNLTNLSDDELLGLKENAERKILIQYLVRHPINGLLYFWHRFYNFLRIHGLGKTLVKLISKIGTGVKKRT